MRRNAVHLKVPVYMFLPCFQFLICGVRIEGVDLHINRSVEIWRANPKSVKIIIKNHVSEDIRQKMSMGRHFRDPNGQNTPSDANFDVTLKR